MSTILLPIKPKYVDKILNKTKLYEYRKVVCKRELDKIIIYSTYPIKKVVGEVKVEKVISSSPLLLWEETKEYSGISEYEYFKYFKGKSVAYAYKLGEVIIYKKQKTLNEIGINYSPQSFVYLDK